jgi:pSer/pThr/pTyr-binding forkhead associated (FHA) protein
MFNKKKIELVAKISIGRDSDNDIVVDNKLASRHHAMIQKIKNAYFLKDENSTNGTFVNGKRIPNDKYVKLNPGDKITIGNMHLVIS